MDYMEAKKVAKENGFEMVMLDYSKYADKYSVTLEKKIYGVMIRHTEVHKDFEYAYGVGVSVLMDRVGLATQASFVTPTGVVTYSGDIRGAVTMYSVLCELWGKGRVTSGSFTPHGFTF